MDAVTLAIQRTPNLFLIKVTCFVVIKCLRYSNRIVDVVRDSREDKYILAMNYLLKIQQGGEGFKI